MAVTDQERTTAARPREVTGEPAEQRSSCEIKTSTRGTDITVKAYVGSPVEVAVTDALAEYKRAFVEMEAWLLGHRQGAA
jgi:hypothetical protein